MTARRKNETPEEHVHASVGRQEKVAKNVATTAKKVAKDAKDKAEILARATDLLSNRVGTLADVVQINNHKIEQLQSEINKKPDDVELQFITGVAVADRQRLLKWSVATAVGSSILTATIGAIIAFQVSEAHGRERCLTNAQNIATIVKILEGASDPTDRLQPFIDDLKSNRNTCR